MASSSSSCKRVAVIGSGNFGSVVAKICAYNCLRRDTLFEPTVRMWTFEEKVDGRNLTEIINEKHENVKYLPGISIGENVVADPDVVHTVEGADVLVFVSPHQFLQKTCDTLKGHVKDGAIAISLIKGMICDKDHNFVLMTDIISGALGIDCCVMSGANIADEIARENFCESTIGYKNLDNARVFQQLFDTPYMRVNVVSDPAAVELSGAIKNVIALACGFCDGLDAGNNSKAAIIRLGLIEMMRFIRMTTGGGLMETFFESSGIADVVTTCYGGRNRKCAEAWVRTKKPMEEIEKELLNGQKLQGPDTLQEMMFIIRARKLEDDFVLFVTVYRILFEGFPAADLFVPLSNIVKLSATI